MKNNTNYHVQSLVKTYNKARVLDVHELNFSSGDFVALMGKNGSGKSTLMRLLAQQELYDSGEILFCGQSLRLKTLNLNPQMVFVTEDQGLPHFKEPLSYWKEMYKKIYPQFDDTIFRQLVSHFEIDLGKNLLQLSRGQKMKALFCLQAPKRPQVYLLDEITSILDAGSRWALMDFLQEEKMRGCLIIMSTNIAEEMQGFATHATFIERGSVIFSDHSDKLKNHFQKVRVPRNTVLLSPMARKIRFNNDDTWVYMAPKSEKLPAVPNMEIDSRGVSISDVQSYFTVHSSASGTPNNGSASGEVKS